MVCRQLKMKTENSVDFVAIILFPHQAFHLQCFFFLLLLTPEIVIVNKKAWKVALQSSNYEEITQPFNEQCCHHTETNQLICSANQLTGSYMMRTLVVNGLISRKYFFVYTAFYQVNIVTKVLSKTMGRVGKKYVKKGGGHRGACLKKGVKIFYTL